MKFEIMNIVAAAALAVGITAASTARAADKDIVDTAVAAGDFKTLAAAFSPYLGALLITLLATVFLLVFVRADRIPVEYALVPVLFIAADLSSGSLEAVGRITMAGFTLVWILANRRSILARRAWPMISVGLFVIVAVLSFGGYWVP